MERLVYVSSARVSGLYEVRHILEASIRNNRYDGISGLLWWHGSFFVQVLEGDTVALDDLMVRLMADTRHANVNVIDRRAIAQRQFGSWGMALVTDPLHYPDFIDRHFGGTLPTPEQAEGEKVADMLMELIAKYPPNMERLLQS